MTDDPIPHTTAEKLAHAERLRERALHAGDERSVQRQRERGKGLARERLERLLDPGSLVELDAFVQHRSSNFGLAERRPYGDGVVTGYGTVHGRKVFVFSQDFTVFGGSLGEAYAEKICKVMDLARALRLPGDRHQRLGRRAHPGGRRRARRLRRDLPPQRDGLRRRAADLARHGPVRGRRGLLARDHRLRADDARDVAHVHHRARGRAHRDRRGGLVRGSRRRGHARAALGRRAPRGRRRGRALRRGALPATFLPQNNLEPVPQVRSDDPRDRCAPELDTIIPDSPTQPYDIKAVIRHVVDDGDFFEIHERYAENIVCGFARLGGHAVGIVGNQPQALAGVLDIDSSVKAARFVRTCDAFGLPLVTFVDVPGFLPGTEQEWNGIIRHGAKLLYAYCEATSPKLAVITRKAYGGAYDVMSSKHVGADFNFAWPTAEVAVMGPEGAVNIVFRNGARRGRRPRRPARRADRRLQGAVREPVHGRRARLRRRRDPPVAHAAGADRRARDGAHQARRAPEAAAREHPVVRARRRRWRGCSRSSSPRPPRRGAEAVRGLDDRALREDRRAGRARRPSAGTMQISFRRYPALGGRALHTLLAIEGGPGIRASAPRATTSRCSARRGRRWRSCWSTSAARGSRS